MSSNGKFFKRYPNARFSLPTPYVATCHVSNFGFYSCFMALEQQYYRVGQSYRQNSFAFFDR
jgi:hypothetical protein